MWNGCLLDVQVGVGTSSRGGKLEGERMATSELVDASRLLPRKGHASRGT